MNIIVILNLFVILIEFLLWIELFGWIIVLIFVLFVVLILFENGKNVFDVSIVFFKLNCDFEIVCLIVYILFV